MANALQLRRGTTTQHNTFTGLAGEVTVDTDKETVVVHDGATAGGFPLAKESNITAASLLTSIKTVDGAASGLDADTLDGKQLATIESEYQAFANTAAANVVDSAPGTLDTLNELAAALGDDANFSTTVTNSIATKVPLAGGTMTGQLIIDGPTDEDLILRGTDPFLRFQEGSADKAYIQWNSTGYLELVNSEDNSRIRLRDNLQFTQDGGTNFHNIWHAGNDGSGSGLDADTLDGVQLSNIARTDTHENFQSSVSFANTTIDPDGYNSGKSGGFGTINDGGGWSAQGLFVTGGAGKSAAIAAASGNIYFGTQDGTNTNSMSSWLTVIQSTKQATFDGRVTVNNTLDIEEVIERVGTSASTTSTITIEATEGAVLYFTANQTANRTINFRGNSGLSLNSLMNNNQSMTFSVAMTQGSTAYYLNAYQVDGSAVTPKWSGGSAPTGGNASGIDVYTFTIIKTANATFTVLASQTQYA